MATLETSMRLMSVVDEAVKIGQANDRMEQTQWLVRDAFLRHSKILVFQMFNYINPFIIKLLFINNLNI